MPQDGLECEDLSRYGDQGSAGLSSPKGSCGTRRCRWAAVVRVLVGLATLDVARLDVPKNCIGVVWGTDMQRVFSGQAGALSNYVAKINPDMIYVFGGDVEMRHYFASIGFQVVYEHPNALVLYRASDQSLEG